MGVRGLLAYIDHNCPNAYDDGVSIECLTTNYRSKEHKEPVVLIDVTSCVIHAYADNNIGNAPRLTGGQFKQFIRFFLNLFRKLENMGITSVVCWDARPPVERFEVWKFRQNYKVKQYETILKLVQRGELNDAEKMGERITPKDGLLLALQGALKTIILQADFKNLKVLVPTNQEQSRSFMMKFIAENKGIFATLAGDPDFCTLEGMETMISIRHLDLNTMTARVYYRSRIATAFSIDSCPHHMATITALCGNDVMPQHYYRQFHIGIIGKKLPKYALDQALIPWHFVIPAVVKWVAENVPADCHGEDVVQFIVSSTGLTNHISAIRMCLKECLLPPSQTSQTTPNPEEKDVSNWDKILQVAEERTSDPKHFARYDILTVVRGDPILVGVKLEIRQLPSVYTIIEQLRRRIFGILLKENPDQPTVIQFIHNGINPEESQVQPEYPDNHPGLLSLWRGEQETCAWRLLCWAVSDNVQVEALQNVPGPLHVPALALFLLREAEGEKVVRWRLEALAAMAVRLMTATADEISQLHVLAQDPRAVHLATAYTVTCGEIYLLADACSAPVGMHLYLPYVFFDGMLFHDIYMTMKEDESIDAANLCGRKNKAAYQKLIKFVFSS